MPDADGLICAYHISSSGQTRALSWETLHSQRRGDEWSWMHFDVNGVRTRGWLTEMSELDEFAIEALLAAETRPRVTTYSGGTLMILRGVNLQPESEPSDMISIRLWVEPNRIISTRVRRLLSVQALRERCDRNNAPANVGEFIIDLNFGLIERMSGTIQSLDEQIDDLDALSLNGAPSRIRSSLATVRQHIIPLRRFLSPQRDALSQLLSARVEWLADWQRGQIREAADRLTRYVEELDAMRERAVVIQDAVATMFSEHMNANMLVLSVVAAVFLPLGLLTGLLGINVADIPGAETPYAFWIVFALLAVVAVLQIWLFHKTGLIDVRTLFRNHDNT